MAEEDIKLGGFELLERIGQGGMGEVWKARQLSLDRLVAVKLLLPTVAKDPVSIKRVMNEARVAARLKHPGIVQVYDAGEEQGRCFFVMEYVDGYSVGQWIKRSGALKRKDALVVAESVAVALHYAWRAAGLIHCDVKPENIMVDQDGTIKVADLGLSRTPGTEAGREGEITGTPGYISPEQSRGDVPLDSRTDIFSLGATLYHMITGRRLFCEGPDREALDSVLTEQVPDPRDVVPDLPVQVCALLERMLARDRESRPKNWHAVLHDLRRVEKGLMPASKAVPEGGSVMICRKAAPSTKTASPARGSGNTRYRTPFFLSMAALLAVTAILFWQLAIRPGLSGRPGSPPAGLPAAGDRGATGDAAEALENALRWARTHDGDYDGAINRFKSVAARFRGTQEALTALVQARMMSERRDRDIAAAWEGLAQRAERLMARGDLDDAVTIVESYTGKWAFETGSNRAQLAQSIRRKMAEREQQRATDGRWEGWLKTMAESLIAGKIGAARQMVEAEAAERRFPGRAAEVGAVAGLLRDQAQVNARILESFNRDMGKTMGLKLGRGEFQVTIQGFRDSKVVCETAEEHAQILFGPEDLSGAERAARMGPADIPAVALAKGIVAVEMKAYTQAEALFAATEPALAKALIGNVRALSGAGVVDPAEEALAQVLLAVGIKTGPYDGAAWLAEVRDCRPSREKAALAGERRERFLRAHGTSEFALQATPVLLALEQVCELAKRESLPDEPPKANIVPEVKDPEPPRTFALEPLVAALSLKNPEMRPGAVTLCQTPNGVGVRVVSDGMTDVTPLAARGLKVLHLETGNGKTVPLDGKPLAGSGIVELRLRGYALKDLSVLRSLRLECLGMPGASAPSYAPLEGLPLVDLDLGGASVRDVTFLRGMRLESLNLDDTKISSLATLAGMPLRRLSLRNTPIRDIGVLRSLPLEYLNVAQTSAFDYQVLRGLGLKTLNLSGTPVRDVAFCAGMPLEELDLSDTPVMDIAPLKGKAFAALILTKTQIRDLAPLEGASIGLLDLRGVRLTHFQLIGSLGKIDVTRLNLAETEIGAVNCLAGKELKELSVKDTRVRDLTPLRNMPIEVLDVRGAAIADLTPLRTMKLKELWIDGNPDLSHAGFYSLKTINGQRR